MNDPKYKIEETKYADGHSTFRAYYLNNGGWGEVDPFLGPANCMEAARTRIRDSENKRLAQLQVGTVIHQYS